MELFEHIRRDRREDGVSIRGLARRHRVHRRTVRQALKSALPPPRKPVAKAAPRLGAHRATIREWLTADLSAPRKQRHTARRIWQRLVDERGASVAESTVRAYVGRVRRELESGRAVVTIPQLHPPGEEAEVDFGGVSVWLDGVLTELSMFVMRLSHSWRAVHVCFPGEGQEAFLEGHTLAFGRLAGVPRRVRYDYLKAAVTRVLAGRDRIESERFTALRSHFGFDAFFCEPGIAGAHEKGGVEGEVGRFRRRHLVPVPRVQSLAELNALLKAADRSDDARHIAGRLATVGRMAEAERPALRPLPAEPFDPTVALQAKADRKARISGRGSRYSVPAACAGRTVDVRLGGGTVTALLGAGCSPATSAARTRGSRSSCSTTTLRCCPASPGRCPARARSRGGFTAAHERFWPRARRKLGDPGGTRALIEVLLLHRHLRAASVHAASAASTRRVFPRLKHLADFDLEAAPYGRPGAAQAEPVVLLGDSGTGKSHLLIGPGMAACRRGLRVRS